MFIRQTKTLAPGIDEFCAGFTVRFTLQKAGGT